jgi:hypothetical protein
VTKKLSFVASRRAGLEFFRWSMLAVAGVCGGMALGEMAAGTRLQAGGDGSASYAHLSANPDALVPPGDATNPCPGCADSYGVAARMRAERDSRMGDEFRELGAVDVDVDTSFPADPDDDYRYGGRFPDPASPSGDGLAQRDELPAVVPASDTAPADTPMISTVE